MSGAGKAVILLLLGWVCIAQAVRHHNITVLPTAGEVDEEGYRYGGKYVPNWASQPPKGKFLQCKYLHPTLSADAATWHDCVTLSTSTTRSASRCPAHAVPYATCPAPYDTFSFVTQIRVCRDVDGFITGIRYFSDHPIRHHDPTTVCDAVGHEGASDCETLKLYTEDWKWRRYRTVTNVRSVTRGKQSIPTTEHVCRVDVAHTCHCSFS